MDSPAKRRRTDAGYNSENDDGDALFADYDETVATLPLTHPYNPAQPTQASPYFASEHPAVTQPTQILDTPIAKRTDPNSVVQVAASSPIAPMRLPTSSPPQPKVRSPPSKLARSAGSRPLHRPETSAGRSSTSASDEEQPAKPQQSKSDIPPSRWASKSKPQQHNQPAAPSAFQSIMAQYEYGSSASVPQKRSSDDMANAYSSSPKRPRAVPRQNAPSRAQPVDDGLTLDGINDYMMRRKVERMMRVYPNKSIAQLNNALAEKRGNFDDALGYICEQEEVEQAASARQHETIDLTAEDESSRAKLSKPSTNMVVKTNQSIASRWSKVKPTNTPSKPTKEKQSPPAQAVIEIADELSAAETPPKPRRRLQRGRKTAARSPSPSEIATPEKASSDRRGKTFMTVDSDSDAENSEEEVDEEAVQEAEESLLSYLNKCEAPGLADLSQQPLADCEGILAKRPFRSLEQVRRIELSPPKLTKSGKVSSKHMSTGTKVLNIAERTWAAYLSVDQLVSECETLGKPITEDMAQLGDQSSTSNSDGGLNIFSIEGAKHDSGVGTPSSSTQADDDDVTVRSRFKALKKPSNMAEFDLQPWQVVGLNWLSILWKYKVSGILADDMGLGKTCTVISFLSHLKETNTGGLALVVVPNTILENWLREFEKFSDGSLRVEPYYGGMKDRADLRVGIEEDRENIDVVVTTYSMLQGTDPKDRKFLRRLNPEICIFDEGHALKNRTSQRHKSAMQIPAKFRLIMSGTPLQNNLQEMVSILSFLMPSMFGEHAENLDFIFREKAKTGESSHAALLSAQRIAKARSMMAPFILRRKKEQVLASLATKTCRVEYCELDPDQEKVYKNVLAQQKKAFMDRKNNQYAKVSANYTMKLRLIANHALLARHIFDDEKVKIMAQDYRERISNVAEMQALEYIRKKNDGALIKFIAENPELEEHQFHGDLWHASGKIQKAVQLIKEFAENGDRTLFFSQFVMVLDIMERVLSDNGIKFVRFDGSTQTAERQNIIDQFTRHEDIPVFMLTTQSGGTGINLTAANKVIINDLSWNPHEDVQAENRAHRVGQQRPVEVVRLVTRGTVEEQILALGESKIALDERVAGSGAQDDDDSKKGGKKDAVVPKTAKAVTDMLFEQMVAAGELEGPAGDDDDLVGQYRNKLEGAGVAMAE